jgi:hypothetical protein
VSQQALTAEKRAWSACFKDGEAPPSEGKVVNALYVEADGVWAHLQREADRWYEVKSAVAYEG